MRLGLGGLCWGGASFRWSCLWCGSGRRRGVAAGLGGAPPLVGGVWCYAALSCQVWPLWLAPSLVSRWRLTAAARWARPIRLAVTPR